MVGGKHHAHMRPIMAPGHFVGEAFGVSGGWEAQFMGKGLYSIIVSFTFLAYVTV